MDKSGQGNGSDWFLWKSEVIEGEDAVTHTVEHPAVTCPDDPEILTEWYTWATGSWAPDAQDADDVNWPQTLVGPGQIAPTDCETTYQQDKYVGTREAIDAVIDDGILTNIGQPEDHLIVQDWVFVSTDECPPEQPDDIVVVGEWQDGEYQCGATEVATTRETSTTTYMFVEDDEQGSWVAQTPVITIETSSRELTPEEQEANVCPFEVTAVAASVADPPICGPNNDTVTITPTEGVTYSDTGWVEGERTITASAMENYVLTGTTSWTFTDEATTCPIDETGGEVTTAAPTVVAKCFPNNDTVTIPEVEGVIYSDTGWVAGQRTITASADEGYTLIGDTSWTFTDVPSAGCPPVGPVFAADELAFTGASSNTGGFVALAILLITSGTALVARKRLAL